MKQFIIISLLLYFIFTQAVYAQESNEKYSQESQVLLKTLEQEIIGTLLAVANNEKKVGKDLTDFSYALSIPQQHYAEFGLVLDFSDYKKGFEVVSVSKGSAADKAGIKAADIIVNINGVTISALKSKPEIASLWDIAATDTVHLGINSAGVYREITAIVPKIYLPEVLLTIKGKDKLSTKTVEDGACGFVSVKLIPRADQRWVALKFKKVDDLNVGNMRKTRQLPVGQHTFTVALGAPRNNVEFDSKKTIEINVEANVIYYVVRKPLGSDKGWRKQRSDWKPVILKTEIKNCD